MTEQTPHGPRKKCAILLPTTVPRHLAARYPDGREHFERVLQELVLPAVSTCMLEPLETFDESMNPLHYLAEADVAVVDLSMNSPNIVLRLSFAVSLQLPICAIWDGIGEKISLPDIRPTRYAPFAAEASRSRDIDRLVKALAPRSKQP
jgi:hypothetical protein